MWTRKCQECGHIQEAKQPNAEAALTEAYANAKCRRCKSLGLDYGRDRDPSQVDKQGSSILKTNGPNV